MIAHFFWVALLQKSQLLIENYIVFNLFNILTRVHLKVKTAGNFSGILKDLTSVGYFYNTIKKYYRHYIILHTEHSLGFITLKKKVSNFYIIYIAKE